jgi:hypothetical protein
VEFIWLRREREEKLCKIEGNFASLNIVRELVGCDCRRRGENVEKKVMNRRNLANLFTYHASKQPTHETLSFFLNLDHGNPFMCRESNAENRKRERNDRRTNNAILTRGSEIQFSMLTDAAEAFR